MEEVVADPEQQRLFYGIVREFIVSFLFCNFVVNVNRNLQMYNYGLNRIMVN